MKPYYRELAETLLPHLLSFYDMDPYSPTRGYGDRYFWGWKLKDFNNGLMQGGAYPLAIFRSLGCFPDSARALDIIKGIFYAVRRMQHRNGSVDEAFPYEYAYSVTSTLAFDLLYALELIEVDLNSDEKNDFLETIARLIDFISTRAETHGFISNHLAAAAAAIEKYHRMTGRKISASGEILDSILKRQSPEGWYLEYEGPDPGYQTLCVYYLAQLYRISREEALLKSLEKSMTFLSHFVHPDGSIGGEYGSRNTELFYPGGVQLMAGEIPVARAISDRMYQAIRDDKTVTLKSVDPGNFIPLVENYLVAYQDSQNRIDGKQGQTLLPWELNDVDAFFPDAGILVRGNDRYYAIVSGAKGGVTKIFDKRKKRRLWDDCGYIGELKNGQTVSTQSYLKRPECSYEAGTLLIKTDFYRVLSQVPSPLKFTLLRVLNLTLMRNIRIGNMVKSRIIKQLITGKKRYPVTLRRKVTFSPGEVIVEDELSKEPRLKFRWLEYGRKFSSIHMASAKYFQGQFWERTLEPQRIDLARFDSQGKINIETRIAPGKGRASDSQA
jgi:hypothetical protein